MNTYVLITVLFGISVMALLFGFQPVAWDYMSTVLAFNENSLTALFDMLLAFFSDWGNAFMLAVGTIVSAIALRGNLSAIVPFMLIFFILNLMVMPSGMFAILGIVGTIIEATLKLMMLLAMVNFLRGY